MTRWLCVFLLWLWVAFPQPLFAASPSPEDEAQAKKLFESANTAFEAKRFAEALELYRQSFAKVPRPSVLFNIARTQEELGDYPAAWMSYQRFLQIADEDSRRRPDAEARLAELQGKIELPVRIVSVPAGAAVTLDGEERVLGVSPLTVKVRPGRHLVGLRAPGRQPKELELTVQIGVDNRLEVVLELVETPVLVERDPGPDTSFRARIVVTTLEDALVFVDALPIVANQAQEVAPGVHTVSVERTGYVPLRRRVRVESGTTQTVSVKLVQERSAGLRAGMWGLAGTGAAAVAAGAILGVMALQSEAEYEELPQRSLGERAARQALWSDVLLGGGAVALISAFVVHRVTRTESTATIGVEAKR
jgi:hypothetical protein